MERVECVTDQVRWSHSRGGDAVGASPEGEAEEYLEGARRVIVVGTLIVPVYHVRSLLALGVRWPLDLTQACFALVWRLTFKV